MKNFYLTSIFLFSLILSAFSQNLITEDFIYEPNDSLEHTGRWTRDGVNSPYNIAVVTPGLVYTDYVGSGRGNSCRITNSGNGDILYQIFPQPLTTGAAYLSFMFKIDNLPATVTQGYFICFNPYNAGTYLNTSMYIKRLSNTTFNIGVRKSDAIVYSNLTYVTGKTYLGVLKYNIINGINNDVSSVYVFENGVPGVEPSLPIAATASGMDFTGQGYVYLTNNYAQSGMEGIDVKVDGIRVGTSWENSVLAMISAVENEKLSEAFYIRNAPNPFSQTTTIEYQIPNRGFVNLIIMDAMGKPCAELVNEMKEGGKHTLDYNAVGLPAGVYTIKLQLNGQTLSNPILKLD